MKIPFYIILSVLLFSSCGVKKPNKINSNVKSTTFNQISEDILKNLKADKKVDALQKKLASATQQDLKTILVTDEQKKAFWINVYNGYIIAILKKDKKQFDDRGAFFTKKQIEIAGKVLSFDDIENGMIRRSQFKFGLGYIAKPFPSAFERSLRVKERDYRIHFAINCGAKSCPPVKIFKAQTVDEELQKSSANYLKQQTKFLENKNTVETSTLMSWFRGDFGGKTGTKSILKEFKLIPENSNPKVTYGSYDWTLDIGNFVN